MQATHLNTTKKLIQYGIWLYLFLLIFEGALRKWFLPGLSNVLLIVRDPVALAIYLLALSQIPKSVFNPYTLVMGGLALTSLATTLAMGHGNIVVGLYGVRVLLLHFPMIFVIGYFMDKEDVVKVGKVLLLIAIPMTMLLALQFNSPQGAFINRLPGGEGGLAGALGRFRPPGTFSFITGTVQFYTLCAGFLMSAFFERRYFSMWITIAVSAALLLAVPISISRTLFLNTAIVMGAGILGVQLAGGSLRLIGRLLVIALLGFIVASQLEVFDEGVESFRDRWDTSTSEERGGIREAIVGRYLNDLIQPIRYAPHVELFGRGIGLGTQAGAGLALGQRGFLMGEGEWERLVFEMGGILGLATIAFRVYFTFKLGSMTFKSLKTKNLLPWLLFSTTALLLFNGQWGQPTTLGFTVVGAGLALAAMRKRKKTANKRIPKKPASPKDREASIQELPSLPAERPTL